MGYLTYDRGARLIAGDYVETEDPVSAPLPRDRLRSLTLRAPKVER